MVMMVVPRGDMTVLIGQSTQLTASEGLWLARQEATSDSLAVAKEMVCTSERSSLSRDRRSLWATKGCFHDHTRSAHYTVCVLRVSVCMCESYVFTHSVGMSIYI